MYKEKIDLIGKIDDYCKEKNISLSFQEKDYLSSSVSRILDKDRTLSFDEFTELLEHNNVLEQYHAITFDDEIVSIEEVDSIAMIDFDISGNKLFYANGVLTHNSATNNIDDADNANVSDSMGTVMTADFLLFLLQNERMKEKKEIVCKITKNRFGGVTDTWLMSVDYEHMRFSDQLVQENDLTNIDITNTLGLNKSQNLSDDFAILTIDRNKEAEKFAKDEINSIVREDVQKIIQHDKKLDKDKKDPFNNDIDVLYKSLGL